VLTVKYACPSCVYVFDAVADLLAFILSVIHMIWDVQVARIVADFHIEIKDEEALQEVASCEGVGKKSVTKVGTSGQACVFRRATRVYVFVLL